MLPHRAEAEHALCGAIFLRGTPAYLECDEAGLAIDDFYLPRCQAVWNAAGILVERGEPIDVITMEAQLRRTAQLELVGGIEGLARFDRYASAHNVLAHAKLVREAAAERRALLLFCDASETIREGDIDPSEWGSHLERWIADLVAIQNTGNIQREATWSIDKVLEQVELEWNDEADGNTRGISTGIEDLDMVLGRVGPRPQWLWVIGGRPAMGKSTLALSLTRAALFDRTASAYGDPRPLWVPKRPWQPRPCVHEGGGPAPRYSTPVLWACSEMTAAELARGLISDLGTLERRATEAPSRSWLNRTHERRAEAMELLRGSELDFVPDQQTSVLEDIVAAATIWRTSHRSDERWNEETQEWEPGRKRPAVLVVDYLQRLRARGFKGTKREEEINYMAQAFKTLARKLDILVVLLCQINRGVESRPDKRPLLSDLRESGAIEQEADIVSFVYRDHYYHPDRSEEDGAEIITRKNRKGPLDTVEVQFHGRYSRFLDRPAPGEAPPYD